MKKVDGVNKNEIWVLLFSKISHVLKKMKVDIFKTITENIMMDDLYRHFKCQPSTKWYEMNLIIALPVEVQAAKSACQILECLEKFWVFTRSYHKTSVR